MYAQMHTEPTMSSAGTTLADARPSGVILGISPEHDSGAAVLDARGEILAAANEERFSRRKLHTGFPRDAILQALAAAGLAPDRVERTVVSTRMHIGENDWQWDKRSLKRDAMTTLLRSRGLKRLLRNPALVCALAWLGETRGFQRSVRAHIAALGLPPPGRFLDHHTCHAAGAIHTCGFAHGLALSFDAQGDGFSCKAFVFEEHGSRKRLVFRNPFFCSPAHYYGYVTGILGFKQMEHEGKVTGLAGYGRADETFPIFDARLRFDAAAGMFLGEGLYIRPEIEYLRRALAKFSREDIAAGVQRHLEENVLGLVRYLVARTRADNLTLAGGIFANVLLNQKIAESGLVRELHVHPHMGDGGLALGAAAEAASALPAYRNACLAHAFLGPEPAGDVDALASRYGLREVRADDSARAAAEHLARGLFVGLVEGRMEYGPRALCHRTILAAPDAPGVKDALNERLQRTEFMPFAPIVLAGDADRLMASIGNKRHAMTFMTITGFTTEEFQRRAPAANHVDNTARPQLVTPDVGTAYRVLRHFKTLTGNAVLINTSFNMHGEPIVASYEDGVRTFLAARLDALLLGGRLFVKA